MILLRKASCSILGSPTTEPGRRGREWRLGSPLLAPILLWAALVLFLPQRVTSFEANPGISFLTQPRAALFRGKPSSPDEAITPLALSSLCCAYTFLRAMGRRFPPHRFVTPGSANAVNPRGIEQNRYHLQSQRRYSQRIISVVRNHEQVPARFFGAVSEPCLFRG